MRRMSLPFVVATLVVAGGGRLAFGQAGQAQVTIAPVTGMICVSTPLNVTVAMLSAGSATSNNIITCTVTTNQGLYDITALDAGAAQDGILRTTVAPITPIGPNPAIFDDVTNNAYGAAAAAITTARAVWTGVVGPIANDPCTLSLAQPVSVTTLPGTYSMDITFTLTGY